ncbi:hypothetical protein FKZ61_002065 [Litorilinea aerophila]|uniref:Uncharacterized protein n=1 Tax=Litorilinea aerophila TaxID=1204385 RepID=A0A540VLM9_9CHLR|nr:hypothetical protein [Litorilinea aerophila]MCC9074901.1 hypothetical protein [Litorilinea aerophila]OUC06465.1 hypothetical protein RY27_20905 [Litorilinea aerophila]
MPDLFELVQQLLQRWELDQFPSLSRILAAMDPVAWTLIGLLAAAIVLGIFFTLSTRRSFLATDEIESTPEILLARLKQDPTRMSPLSIISRLGAEATLELLEYGDQIRTKEWRYRWSAVREELLRLLSQQNAFGPTYALARYYRSADPQEPDTIRIRRTVLIHKLGQLRYLEPNPDGKPAQLRIRCHPAEVEGDLGFEGETLWLMPDEPAPPAEGPIIEMEPIDFHTLQDAELRIHIRRTPTVGGGFRLVLRKRRKMWIVVDEEVEWVS